MPYQRHTDGIHTNCERHAHLVEQVRIAHPVRTPLLSHGQAENAARNQGIVGVGSARGPARLPMQQAGLYRAPSIQTVTVKSSDDVDSSELFHDRRKGCVKGDTSVMASDALIFRTMGVSCRPVLPGETGNLANFLVALSPVQKLQLALVRLSSLALQLQRRSRRRLACQHLARLALAGERQEVLDPTRLHHRRAGLALVHVGEQRRRVLRIVVADRFEMHQ